MPLTEKQQIAHDLVTDYFKKGKTRVKLIGSAGTGKTFLAGEIVKTLKKSYDVNKVYNNGQIYVTAPTNKALAVLKTKVPDIATFSTIHSALKLRRFVDGKTGKESFVKAWSKDDGFKDCKGALIDECSMLGVLMEGGMVANPYTGVLEYQRGYLDGYGFPILYLGRMLPN